MTWSNARSGFRLGLVGSLLFVAIVCGEKQASAETIVVGSKKFNESYILAEMMAQLLESDGFTVDRRFGLGGTLVCYEALTKGEIQVYPEYSGTLEQAILKSDKRLSYAELSRELDTGHGLRLGDPFGFNNTYALALKRSRAVDLGIETISDLAGAGHLRYAFSHEFLNRNDGWPGMALLYGITGTPRGIEHGLAYQAIEQGKIDVTDVYSTDGDIEKYDLVLLEDDRGYFPTYLAAPLYRGDLSEPVKRTLNLLGDIISAEDMRRLNADVLLRGASFADVAGAFLKEKGLTSRTDAGETQFWRDLSRRTLTHLKLTVIALLASIVIAGPLGVLIYHAKRMARVVVYVAGVLQTVPSIALLALMIPLFGIGAVPAIVALFLYALLPILRNTATALFSIDPVLIRVGVGMGMTTGQRLRYIELPLAMPTILAGIKTAAVINIGTATLAAFIGAGGLGEPIVTGLALNDTRLILEGAVPAALLAVLTELGFEGLERALVPRHLLRARSD